MICATCVAIEASTDDQLRRLVVWQARQIHRLTGGYEEPDFDALDAAFPDEPEGPAPELLPVLESVLGYDDVYRKPPRVAAPKLLHHLTEAGWTLTYGDDE